ncbi:MAG: galactokinase [Propionibacteriales bacterium]|nr:galactokinase [Propionibacteriales bacterium]
MNPGLAVDPVAWRVPGRLEVFGTHTDYAGGDVLVCAIDRGVTVEARAVAGAEPMITAGSDAAKSGVVVRPGEPTPYPPGHWGRYLQTVVDRLSANFGPLRPAELRFTSELPLASGMSSSSALIVAAALALADLNGFSDSPAWHRAAPDRLQLAGYLACVENGKSWGELDGALGVGTLGGSEDHTAMLCGLPDQLSQYRFDPLSLVRTVAFPSEWTFVVAVSGVRAEKTAAALADYNRASLAMAEVLHRWQQATGGREASVAAALRTDAERLRALVADAPALSRRLAHFVTESTDLVPTAAQAFAAADWTAVAEAAARSQRAAADLLGNQVPATNALADLAHGLGAPAASFGAGFGGSVWALTTSGEAEAFAAEWLAGYRARFPEFADASVLVTRPGPAATRLS